MTDDFTPQTDDTTSTRRPVLGLGQIVTGSILVMVGFAWLAEAADWFDVPWRGLLAGALVVVGVALMFGARHGSHGGLIAFGVVLAVLLSLSSAIAVLADIPLSGGIGEQRHRPTATLDAEYRWGLGQMTLDLRDLDPAEAARRLEASVAIGELVVYLPDDLAVTVDARAGIGEVVVLGERSSGFDATMSATTQATDATGGQLTLDLEVAIGKVEVSR